MVRLAWKSFKLPNPIQKEKVIDKIGQFKLRIWVKNELKLLDTLEFLTFFLSIYINMPFGINKRESYNCLFYINASF